MNQCQKKSSFGVYGTRGDIRGRHTNNPGGHHSIRIKSVIHLPHPPFFTLDTLPATTLPIYPGLGQAPNMLACIPNGLVIPSGLYVNLYIQLMCRHCVDMAAFVVWLWMAVWNRMIACHTSSIVIVTLLARIEVQMPWPYQQGSHASRKVLDFFLKISRSWRMSLVLEIKV